MFLLALLQACRQRRPYLVRRALYSYECYTRTRAHHTRANLHLGTLVYSYEYFSFSGTYQLLCSQVLYEYEYSSRRLHLRCTRTSTGVVRTLAAPTPPLYWEGRRICRNRTVLVFVQRSISDIRYSIFAIHTVRRRG